MIFGELSRKYSPLEAWLHEHFIADRVLGTQSDILSEKNWPKFWPKRRSVLCSTSDAGVDKEI